MPYFAVLHQYEIDNLEIIISQRKKPFIVVLQLLYNKTVINRLFREVQSMDISIRPFDFLLYISYKITFFKKKYFKAMSGQIFMKFISRHTELF